MQGVLTFQAVQGMPIHTNLTDAGFVLLQLPPHPTLRRVCGVEPVVSESAVAAVSLAQLEAEAACLLRRGGM